jgi:serine phosphatase RsbU (regulator of sigma subunit)
VRADEGAAAHRDAVARALERSALTRDELWVRYFALGGQASLDEVELYLTGGRSLGAQERHLLSVVVHEHAQSLVAGLPLADPHGAPGRHTFAALADLLVRTRHVPPERLVREVQRAGRHLGAERTTIHLVDYRQHELLPVRPDPDDPGGLVVGEPLRVDTSLAGRAYQQVRTLVGDAGGRASLWVPLLDGDERLGVLELVLEESVDPHDAGLLQDCFLVAALVAHLISSLVVYGDALESARRRRPRTAAAELVWDILPPLTASTDDLPVAGRLEPSEAVGGDAFDYALSETRAWLGIFDATGHSLGSGLVAAAALATSRSVRRAGGGLFDQARAVDEVVAQQFAPAGLFLTAVLAELDLVRGRLRYLVAGHPPPLLLRQGRVVATLDAGRRPLFGVDVVPAEVGEHQLEPGDGLLLYTDGLTEGRDASGEPFGTDRLADVLERAAAAGYPPAETVRRLTAAALDFQDGAPRDDVTVLLVTWSGPPGRQRHPGR